MIKITNQESGKEIEVSEAEFMKMLSKNGGIQQVVTDRDGNKRISDIWGNMSGIQNGLDRSVNVFCTMADLIPFISYCLESAGENWSEQHEEPTEPEAGYIMTVDLTDNPVTIVITRTLEQVEFVEYIRDERKTLSDSNKMNYKKWPLNNGCFNMTGIDQTILRTDQPLFFMLAVTGLRKFLKQKGLLEKLQHMDNKCSGIVISRFDNEINAKIVFGLSRPELPCNTFFSGVQMCRPYPDEPMIEMIIQSMSQEEKEAAAESGDTVAMEALAMAYLDGNGVDQDFERSSYWWGKLADTGYSIAQFNMGTYAAKGCGVPRDFDKASEWMQKAADSGDKDGARASKEYKRIAETLRKAEAGDAQAQAEMSKNYTSLAGSVEQFGPEKDYAEAYYWAKKAAEQENAEGIYCLALCYEYGRGTVKSGKKAVEIYERAAIMGHAPSQWNLGVHYLNGQDVEHNEIIGLWWAYQAADQGYDLAVTGLQNNGKSIDSLKAICAAGDLPLENTRSDGRADHCENLCRGSELSYKIVKDRSGNEVIELFYMGSTVGLLARRITSSLIALLKLNRIDIKVTVTNCIPKSQRGSYAKAAEVTLQITIVEKKPETLEERKERLAKEAAAAKAAKEAAAARKKAEAQAAENEQRAWEAECAAIQEKKAADRAASLKKLEEANQKVQQSLDHDESKALATAKEAINRKEKELSDAKAARETLGFFAFSRKMELKKHIVAAEAQLFELKNEPDKIRKIYADKRNAFKKQIETERNNLEARLNRKYVNPMSPKQKQLAVEKERKIRSISDRLKLGIYRYLSSYGEATITGIVENCPEAAGSSNALVASRVRQLIEDGLVQRTVVGRRTYFKVTEEYFSER